MDEANRLSIYYQHIKGGEVGKYRVHTYRGELGRLRDFLISICLQKPKVGENREGLQLWYPGTRYKYKLLYRWDVMNPYSTTRDYSRFLVPNGQRH